MTTWRIPGPWRNLACFLALALSGLAFAQAALAQSQRRPQPQPAPALRVTASLQAPAQVRIGTTLQLHLDVMTPTWFTQPPQLPALDLPGIAVTPPTGQGELRRDTLNGVAYSGLRYTYLLSPTAAGAVQVPALAVSAQVGPHNDIASGTSQPLTFAVAAPAATEAPGLVSTQLTVSQDFSLAPDPLVVGGRVTRTITQRAPGVPALMLPAAVMPDVPGFTRYPLEPMVTPLNDGRGQFVGGQRIDRADYVAQQAGSYRLPAITVRWRDEATGQPAQAELPGREFTVAAAPNATPPFSLADDLAHLRHGLRWVIPAAWMQWGAALLAAIAVAWLTGPRWRALGRRLRQRTEHALAARRASEAWHWRAWQREARGQTVFKTAPQTASQTASLTAFYRWLRLAAGAQDLRTGVAPLGDDARRIAADVLRSAYGAPSAGTAWRRTLGQASRAWRHAWRTRRTPLAPYSLPGALNPQAPDERRPRPEAQGSA